MDAQPEQKEQLAVNIIRSGDIPYQSPCCESHILPREGELYCHQCNQAVVDFKGPLRRAALAELRWERLRPEVVSLMWRNLRVAYARDVTCYDGHSWRVKSVTYKWVIGCSDADFSRIARALGLDTTGMDYPGRFDFPTLKAAALDLWSYLADREEKGAIPELPNLESVG